MNQKVCSTLCLMTAMALSACGDNKVEPVTEAPVPAATNTSEVQASAGSRTSYPEQLLWGDTHLHTAYSMDAGLFGNRLPPEAAYRFAKGEQVTSTTGITTQLSEPLDFLVIADHSDNLGFFPKLAAGDPATFIAQQRAYSSPIWYKP